MGNGMNYRKLGATGIRVSEIGIGTEYLLGVSRETVTSVVHKAIDGGINYFDLLMYMAEDIENFGHAFKGNRDKVILAGHLGIANTDGQYRKTRDINECSKLFDGFLSRLNAGHVDVLHLHNVDEEEDYERMVQAGGLLELALRLKKEGKVRFIGFSGHRIPVALKAIESGHIDVIMHPVNMLWEPVKRIEMSNLCKSKGVGLVAMKPFAGGELFQRKELGAVTPVKCLSYILSQTEVSTVVPGVKNLEELDSVLQYLNVGPEERSFLEITKGLHGEFEGTCLYCNHCLPCPSVIDVGKTMRIWAKSRYGVDDGLRSAYSELPVKASACIECGECMQRCPFGVDVISRMKQLTQMLE